MDSTITANETTYEDMFDVERQAALYLGPVRDSLSTVVPMTTLYVLLLLTGTIGNVCTCIVIAHNRYMHTATNFYLFSLAVSDLLLLVLGLPQELFMLWSKYPYVFGEFFCFVRGLSSETSTNASILTITAFTVERYAAICHPLRSHTMSQLPRAIKSILVIWAVSAICAMPVAWQFGIVSVLNTPRLHSISRQCSIKAIVFEYGFETSAIVFFMVPITLITILYVLIGVELRKSAGAGSQIQCYESKVIGGAGAGGHKELSSNTTQYSETRVSLPTTAAVGSGGVGGGAAPEIHVSLHHQQRHNSVSSSQQKQIASRRSVIRMLVAVVIAFFICYSPFHAQRVLATLIARQGQSSQASPTLVFIFTMFTHISGITYYLSATINPILYQVLSQKFRLAFRDTFGRCLPCVRMGVPEIVYSNIGGTGGVGGASGVSAYKLSRTGSVYSNGSFRRASINFDVPATPSTMKKTSSVGHFSFNSSPPTTPAAAAAAGTAERCSTVGDRVPLDGDGGALSKSVDGNVGDRLVVPTTTTNTEPTLSSSLTVPNIVDAVGGSSRSNSTVSLPPGQHDRSAEATTQFLLVPSFKF